MLLVERLAEVACLAADDDQQVAFAPSGAMSADAARGSGMRPTPPIAGVGGMPTPLVSL